MSEPPSVCVVGAGRLARAFTRRLAPELTVAAVSRRCGDLPGPDGRPDITVGADPAVVSAADLVLLAVPATDVQAAVRWVAPHLDPGTLVVNTATEADTPSLAAPFPDVRIVAVKIVGQAGEIERGARPVFVVDHASPAELELLARVLGPVGTMVEGPEQMVAELNLMVATRVVRARRMLEVDLRTRGFADALVTAGTGSLAVGVWRALAADDAGPFLRAVVERVSAEWGGACGDRPRQDAGRDRPR